MNWLGTDDQGRDVLARLIYGFRISVLFGLVLTGLSSVVGVTAGAIQGYFGGLIDLGFQRFDGIWSGLPILYLLIIIASFMRAQFLVASGLHAAVLLDGAGRPGPCRVPARPQLRLRARRPGARRFNPVIIFRHVLPNALVATFTFMPFLLSGRSPLYLARFPRASASRRLRLARGAARPGKANLQAPWLGLTAFFVLAVDAEPLDLCRRSGARCVRSAQGRLWLTERCRSLLAIRDLSVTFGRSRERRTVEAVKRRLTLPRSRRDAHTGR